MGVYDSREAARHGGKFVHYAEWMAMSLEEKQARHNAGKAPDHPTFVKKGTDIEFAALFKVRGATLSEWKLDPKLWRLRDQFMLPMRQHTAPVLRGLIRNCIAKGQGQDVRVFMEIVEGMRFTGQEGAAATGRMLGRVLQAAGDDLQGVKGKENDDGTVDLTLRLKKYEGDGQESQGGDDGGK